jgi:hypothetical protein
MGKNVTCLVQPLTFELIRSTDVECSSEQCRSGMGCGRKWVLGSDSSAQRDLDSI